MVRTDMFTASHLRMSQEIQAARVAGHEHEQWAAKALEYLQLALTAAQNAKAPRTAARIAHAISSAKGAVRAGRYRDNRQAGQ